LSSALVRARLVTAVLSVWLLVPPPLLAALVAAPSSPVVRVRLVATSSLLAVLALTASRGASPFLVATSLWTPLAS